MPQPSMTSKKSPLLLSFQVGNDYMIGVYQGSLSQFDIIVKYKQKENGDGVGFELPNIFIGLLI